MKELTRMIDEHLKRNVFELCEARMREETAVNVSITKA
jgi:hypothetical protein